MHQRSLLHFPAFTIQEQSYLPAHVHKSSARSLSVGQLYYSTVQYGVSGSSTPRVQARKVWIQEVAHTLEIRPTMELELCASALWVQEQQD